MDSKWRPENWEQIKGEIALTPEVWSASGGGEPRIKNIIELTASKILEALPDEGLPENTKPNQVG